MSKKTKLDVVEELAQTIADEINKAAGEPTAYFIGEEETPTDLSDFISTGSSILDLAISNRPNGGMACGRILELSGAEQSGKSLICAHMIANVQKAGGVAVLIDTESAVNEEFFQAVGVDFSKLIYVHSNIVEDIFAHIEKIVELVRKSKNKDKKCIIVLDSIAGATTKAELEADYDLRGYATDKAKIIGQSLRKLTSMIARQKIALVITNQLRHKMNAQPFADPYTTPGGKAIPFHSSVRVRLAMLKKIQSKEKKNIGVIVKASIVKNRLGPPSRTAEFDIYFDRGIDDVTSWIRFLKDNGVIKGDVRGYEFVDADGVAHEFTVGSWPSFISNNKNIADQIYARACEEMIMLYKSTGLSTEDGSVEVVDATAEDAE